jgi:2-dehydro-3-deoxyphosphooctonate aldolase (KDO 8-P synthase)
MPAFLLGPCVIESEKFVRRMARKIATSCAAEKLPFIFKASYDKANRTSVRSFRGIGAREGCALLGEIGREIGMPVTTDVHSPDEARSRPSSSTSCKFRHFSVVKPISSALRRRPVGS